ncbi:MAG TPA: MerR family transcriptional regulator [Dongiaceae bacterium]|nr:MerR family transcriptional regulator [Dongiaceae bacterium]
MGAQAQHIGPAEAAKRLGVSAKALRVYEEYGLLAPVRTAAGWRTYGAEQMRRAFDIVGLRRLGLSLAQIARALEGDAATLEPVLAAQQAKLEAEIRTMMEMAEKLRGFRGDLASERKPDAAGLVSMLSANAEPVIAFDLPWPWAGERFELRERRRLSHIVGPLGSGKTRLATCLAKTLPNAVFLPMERVEKPPRRNIDATHRGRVEAAITWIVDDAGHESDALLTLITELADERPSAFVIDMIEQGLDRETQEALIAYLRHGRCDARPLFFLTRSSAILDLGAVGPDEAVILCPANHNPPSVVAPYPGAPGYEAVATCLASPEVRKRTEGVIAWRP